MEGFFLTEALVFLIVFVVSSTFYFLFAGPAAVEEFSLLLIVLALLKIAKKKMDIMFARRALGEKTS